METPKRNFEDANPNELKKLMHDALHLGTTRALEILFDDGMDVNQEDYSGRTALMLSAASGNIDAVEMLLKRGADVNRIYMYQERLPFTALDAARQSRNTEIADMLLAHGGKTGKELKVIPHPQTTPQQP